MLLIKPMIWIPMTLIVMNLTQPRLLSWRIFPGMASDALTETETEITSDSNIIPYSQYLSETQQATVQNSNSSAQQGSALIFIYV
ncbi:hypothetical protein Tco_0429530 [Tanacetum coccineum]